MTIRRQLQILLLSALAFLGVVGAAGLIATSRLAAVVEDFDNSKTPALQALADIGTSVGQANGAAAALENGALDAEAHKTAAAEMTEETGHVSRDLEHLDKVKNLEALNAVMAKGRPVLASWKEGQGELLRLAQERAAASSRFAEAAAIQARLTTRYEQVRKDSVKLYLILDEAAEAIGAASSALHERAQAVTVTSRWTMILALLAAAALLVGAGLFLARSVNRSIAALRAEAHQLTTSVNQGRLSARADPAVVGLEFQPVLAGFNETMDAFARPIQVTADYVNRISRGDLPPAITDDYQGDFDAIKQSLNRCIASLSVLAEEVGVVIESGAAGQLSRRADASRSEGVYRKLLQGVNGTLDAVLAPIEEARGALERLADRDLTARVAGQYRGDHAAIQVAINGAAGALQKAMTQVGEAVEQVSGAAAQIATSSQAVASGASEQASSLEETHASLESMSAMTRNAADAAQQANGLAAGTRTSAEAGAAAMEQMSAAMGKIKHSAEGTSAIIKDISEIAFQTNLLALNAAVEAARAGEAGRGFAVVAEEVRSLALRAKEAAVKTEELIKQSVAQAGEGEQVSRLASGKLAEIVANAQKVSEIVAEMAASSKEQAAGIQQVSKAVGEMDKVTQQNAASSEESSSAAEQLSSQSEELAALVAGFKVEEGAGGAAQAALPPPRRRPAQGPLARA